MATITITTGIWLLFDVSSQDWERLDNFSSNMQRETPGDKCTLNDRWDQRWMQYPNTYCRKWGVSVSFQECTSETTQVRAGSMLRNVLKGNCKKITRKLLKYKVYISQWLEAENHQGDTTLRRRVVAGPLLKSGPSSSRLQHQLWLISTPVSHEQQKRWVVAEVGTEILTAPPTQGLPLGDWCLFSRCAWKEKNSNHQI